MLRTVIFLCLFLTVCASKSHANSEAQQQVKAQFIYNFLNYVEWPEDAFETDTMPFRICIFGNVPFSGYLLSFSGSKIGERELTFVISNAMRDIEYGCHILYVGKDRKLDLKNFWSQIKYVYVLSVGEQDDFSEQGGIINIMRTKDRLEFDVNITNALENGLFLDSDLLSLARTIQRNTSQ